VYLIIISILKIIILLRIIWTLF